MFKLLFIILSHKINQNHYQKGHLINIHEQHVTLYHRIRIITFK